MAGTYGVVVSAGAGLSAWRYMSAVGTVLGVAGELASLVAKAIDPALKIQQRIVPASALSCIEVSVDLMGAATEEGGAIIDAIEGARNIFFKLSSSVKDGNDVVIIVKNLTDFLCNNRAVKNFNMLPCIYIDRKKITTLIEKIRSIDAVSTGSIEIELKSGNMSFEISYDSKIKKNQMSIDSDKKEYASEGKFVLSSIVLDKDKKWIAHIDGKPVNILINDKNYLLNVRSGKQKFSCDDVLVAKFHFVENKITGEKLYYIIKVIEHIESKKELQQSFLNV